MRLAIQQLHEFAYDVSNDASNFFQKDAERLTTCGFCLERLPRSMSESPQSPMLVLIGPCGHLFHATSRDGGSCTCYQKVTQLNRDVLSYAHCAHCRRASMPLPIQEDFGAGYDAKSYVPTSHATNGVRSEHGVSRGYVSTSPSSGGSEFRAPLPPRLHPDAPFGDNGTPPTHGLYENGRGNFHTKHSRTSYFGRGRFVQDSWSNAKRDGGRGRGRGRSGYAWGHGLVSRASREDGVDFDPNRFDAIFKSEGNEEGMVCQSPSRFQKSFKSALEGSESGDEDRRPKKNGKTECNDLEKILNEPN